MYFSSSLLLALLPALISANDQAPLKDKAAGWFDKAKAYVSSGTPDIPNPIDAGAAKVADYKVEKINIRNYQRKLGPKPDGEEEWMIYITGGNKTCRGLCGRADKIWNESVPLLAALEPFSGSKLKLGSINCDAEEVFCTSLACAVPTIFHFIFPQAASGAQSQAPSPMRDILVNISRVTTSEIVSIPRASKATYLDTEEYVGAFHPVDGMLEKFGLLKAVGYALWGFGSTPSWLFMVAISFFSRQMMARKAANRATLNNSGRPAAAPGGAGAGVGAGARVGAASGASPAGAKGGAKKRK